MSSVEPRISQRPSSNDSQHKALARANCKILIVGKGLGDWKDKYLKNTYPSGRRQICEAFEQLQPAARTQYALGIEKFVIFSKLVD